MLILLYNNAILVIHFLTSFTNGTWCFIKRSIAICPKKERITKPLQYNLNNQENKFLIMGLYHIYIY